MYTRTGSGSETRAEQAAERAQDAIDARYMRGAISNADYSKACRRIAHELERAACRMRPASFRQMHAEG